MKGNPRQPVVSAGALSPAEQDATSDDVMTLRQRVAELEQTVRQSTTDVNAAVGDKETGWFIR